MDQETLRLLITATASVAAGLIGALIGFASAQRAAVRTIAGQRQLALDKDIRDARRESTRSALTEIDLMANRYAQTAWAIKTRKFDEVKRLTVLIDEEAPASWAFTSISYGAFKEAHTHILDLDGEWSEAILPTGTIDTLASMPEEKLDELVERARIFASEYTEALADLYRAAEAYWARLP